MIVSVWYSLTHARVAKLVDALALGASGATHEGSSPFPGTNAKIETCVSIFAFVSRGHVFAIHNTKTDEAGQEVLNERSEFRSLRLESPISYRVF